MAGGGVAGFQSQQVEVGKARVVRIPASGHEEVMGKQVGQGLAALIYEHAFDYMDAPIQHVTGADVPMPYSKVLERAAIPNKNAIINAVKAIVPAALVHH